MMVFHGIPLDCINHAAVTYHVPASVIVSIIQTEEGKNGDAIKNKNGSYDLGVMQINTSWIRDIEKRGIDRQSVQYNACVNVHVGAWILAQGLSKNSGWQGVANYHSATPKHNSVYRIKVRKAYIRNMAVIGMDA